MINQMGTNHGVKLGCTYGNTLTNPEGITIIDHYWNFIEQLHHSIYGI